MKKRKKKALLITTDQGGSKASFNVRLCLLCLLVSVQRYDARQLLKNKMS